MSALAVAKALEATLPFKYWRKTLGSGSPADHARAATWASHVDWAARLLPLATKCLPRAMALSWLLRRRRIGHTIIFAVRPVGQRDGDDTLHAWVEVDGRTILGDLPGPWIETLRLGGASGGVNSD